jgi:hypothetical protein
MDTVALGPGVASACNFLRGQTNEMKEVEGKVLVELQGVAR